MDKPPEVPLKKRWLLFAGAWGVAFLFCILSDPRSIGLLIWFLPFFPTGLIAWFNPRSENIVLLALLWLAYMIHGYFTLTASERGRFYRFLSILAVVLSLNVVGCHRVDVSFH